MGSAALPWDFTSYYLFSGLGVIIIGLVLYMITSLKELHLKITAGSSEERKPLVGGRTASWGSIESPEASISPKAYAEAETTPIQIIGHQSDLADLETSPALSIAGSL